jgi:murein DD-endopeptidase MepM/ murein hydrolase activator NlpD
MKFFAARHGLILLLLISLSIACGTDEHSDNPADVADPSETQPLAPVRLVADLETGESQTLVLPSGGAVTLYLQQTGAESDSIRGAVRSSWIFIEVNGEPTRVDCGNYCLPIEVGGVRIDCPVTYALYENSDEDRWGLRKDARVRIWPKEGSLFGEAPLLYPVAGQRWLPNRSQAGNEPTDDYLPFLDAIYYHSGVDFGGCDGNESVVAAASGRVVLTNGEVLRGYANTPAVLQSHFGDIRTDVVFIEDERGWLYRYSHLHSIAPNVRLGEPIFAGDPVGLLGNEGASGGWAHLHFEIYSQQPSGPWGSEAAYAYLWEGYAAVDQPPLLAVARPHKFGVVGDFIELDGSRSVGFEGEIVDHEWTFTDGTTMKGAKVRRRYEQPGFFTELLKVTDELGNTAYDFVPVQIVHADPFPTYTYMHAAHCPSKDIRPDDEVTFYVRVFGTAGGQEAWDFGDGSLIGITHSSIQPFTEYATITHTYDEPGDYLVRVERINKRGEPIVAQLWVRVSE